MKMKMKNGRLSVLCLIFTAMLLTSTIAFFRVNAASSWIGYVKPSFPDYAPSGMPDFDEKQDHWGPLGTYTWCVPVAVANSLWWLDSKYESVFDPAPVPPPTISDHFLLVTAYGAWDDHSPNNVDPLVRNLAFLMDTDGQRTGGGHVGTRFVDVQSGIQQYLVQQGVASLFEVHNASFPDFVWINNETQVCQDVELFIEFWQLTPGGWTNTTITNPSLELGHCVTCAGANSSISQLLISDPWQDAYESGAAPGRSPVPHAYPHNSAVHNDAQYVSQDAYSAVPFVLPQVPPPPPGYPPTVWELQGYLQTMGYDPSFHAFIKGAVAVSPTGVDDVAVTNVTSPKKVIFPGYAGNVTATVENHGDYPETFNVTLYANLTATGNTTMFARFVNVALDSGESADLTATWGTKGFASGNYTLIAAADIVPGETHTADNNFTDGYIVISSLVGDLTGAPGHSLWDFVPDGYVDGSDLIVVAMCFGSYPGVPPPYRWNANCDITNDNSVDGSDLIIIARHFGEHV